MGREKHRNMYLFVAANVTDGPSASHQIALTIFHPCPSFRTLSLTYAMMGSRTSMEPKHQVRRTQGRFPAVMENNPKLRIKYQTKSFLT
jgi:hypothetical protein